MKSFHTFAQNSKIYIWLHCIGIISTSQLNASHQEENQNSKGDNLFQKTCAQLQWLHGEEEFLFASKTG